MQNKLRYIVLLPFSLIYGLITYVRNLLYSNGLLKSQSPSLPVISVGNLTVGGTGKTPHVEYLIQLLQENYKIAVLSRGFKRKTTGFLLANADSDSNTIGDEPYQIFKKHKNIIVAVDENRVHGVTELLKVRPEMEVVILDDAFQHRAINPGLKILLTDYSRLYVDDSMLPGGLLREYSIGSKRADIIIVTKCPSGINDFEINTLETKIKPLPFQQLFFSTIVYGQIRSVFSIAENNNLIENVKKMHILLVTGIVSHLPLVEELTSRGAVVELCTFPDHHNFSLNNYTEIERKFIHLQSDNKMILVTEKDAARITSSTTYPVSLRKSTFYIPITIQILHNKQTLFKNKILNYVESYKRNS